MSTIIDPCVHCGQSTAFGFGRFVNRIGYDDGWACAECMAYECFVCDEKVDMDTYVSDEEEWGHYHPRCLPIEKWDEASKEFFEGMSSEERLAFMLT